MAAQKGKKKKIQQKILCTLECLLTQNPSNQNSQISWFFKTKYKTITKSKEKEALGNYFCLKIISKLAPQ